MTRNLSSLLATTFALALAAPVLARPASPDLPSCGDEKKDEKKPPSAAEPRCDGDKGDKKDDKKDDGKDPARL